MGTLNLRFGGDLDGDSSIQFGDKNTDVAINAGTPVFHVDDVSVAATHGTAVLWITGAGGIGAWTYGIIISDQDIYFQQKNDIGTPQFARGFIPANTPRFISYRTGGSTASQLTGSALANGTAYGSTVEIKVQNESLTTAANVSLFLFT
jgi:hypothetical protein